MRDEDKTSKLREEVGPTELTIPVRSGDQLVSPSMPQIIDRMRQLGLQSELSADSSFSRTSVIEIGGIELRKLQRLARLNAIALASEYTSRYRSVVMPLAREFCHSSGNQIDSTSFAPGLSKDLGEPTGDLVPPVIMGGHQPDLFHCGVWFKNFLLSEIASETRAIAIHFLVDNDLCRSTSIQVPTSSAIAATDNGEVEFGQIAKKSFDPAATHSHQSPSFDKTEDSWRSTEVYYDSPRAPVPWENCTLQNLELWKSFPSRVRKLLPALNSEPLIDRLWSVMEPEAKAGMNIGYLLSQARHQLEQDLGLQTLEVPLSMLVSTPEFARFSLHLLNELPKLHEIYNAELMSYRRQHRIRNHAQPLPNLGKEDLWFETPWWYYPADSQTRFPLWACETKAGLVLSNRQGWQIQISGGASSSSAVDQWLEELSQGSCLRPRALLTTMYARMVLSDLFVHGMGGARYDQLTDRIIERFFDTVPPPVTLATTTVHLPFRDLSPELSEPPKQQVLHWQQLLRLFQSNPEAGFRQWSVDLPAEQIGELQQLQVAKQELLSNIPPKGQKWEWHSRMKQINERLMELALPSIQKIRGEIEHFQSIENQQSIVSSREYSFCLFPIETIVETLKIRE